MDPHCNFSVEQDTKVDIGRVDSDIVHSILDITEENSFYLRDIIEQQHSRAKKELVEVLQLFFCNVNMLIQATDPS